MGLLVDGTWQDRWYDTAKTDGRFERQASSFRHWVTPDGSERAVAVLELAVFRQSVRNGDGDDKLRREMSDNLERAFDQLAKQ